MKYIVIPIAKTLWLLCVILILYPFAFTLAFLAGFWGFDWKIYKEIKKSHYYGGHTAGGRYYIYTTVWDWYLDRKKFY